MDRIMIVTNVLVPGVGIQKNGWDLMPEALFNCTSDDSCNNILQADRLIDYRVYFDMIYMANFVHILLVYVFKIFLNLFVVFVGNEEPVLAETRAMRQMRRRRLRVAIDEDLWKLTECIILYLIIPHMITALLNRIMLYL